MPLVRIDHAAGKLASYRAAISQGVHEAMVRTFDVPDDDRFQVICEQAPGTAIVHAPGYLGIEYSDELDVIQITCNDTRRATSGRHYQPGRGQTRELVLWKRDRPVCPAVGSAPRGQGMANRAQPWRVQVGTTRAPFRFDRLRQLAPDLAVTQDPEACSTSKWSTCGSPTGRRPPNAWSTALWTRS